MDRPGIHGVLEVRLRAVSAAHGVLERAQQQRNWVAASAARQGLRAAVDAARDAGASWMQIGDLLDIARGNAYRQYRQRPARGGDAHPRTDRDSG